MSAVGLIREGDAGDDPERIREGMSGNLCRCGAYAGITEAVREAQQRPRRGATEDRMNRFDYVRPASVAEAIAAAAEPGAAYLAAGTNLLDLMKTGAARPSRLVDVTRLPGPRPDRACCRTAAPGSARWSATPTSPATAASRAAFPGGRRGAAVGRLAAAPQRRDRRRQPDAAHALRLFLRPRQRLQPARAGRGLRRARAARTAATRSSAGATPASPRTLPTSACRWWRSTPSSRSPGPAGTRDAAARGAPPPARRQPGARDRARAGRAHRRPAPAAGGRGRPRATPAT